MDHLFRKPEVVQHEPLNTPAPFLDLPPEIMLNIADFLDEEFVVLLSLSCKSLWRLLRYHYSLCLYDVSVRTNFLRYLEIDCPELLTCRVCGQMFLWRKRKSAIYTCPQALHHPIEARLAVGSIVICRPHHVLLNPNLVQLVLRAHRRGHKHGLPVSSINSNCSASGDTQVRTEARVVDGMLLLSSCWILDVESVKTLPRKLKSLSQALCQHSWAIPAAKLWDTVAQRAALIDGLDVPVSEKCSLCATDYKIFLHKIGKEGFRVVLKAWRNLGDGQMDDPGVDQIFDDCPRCSVDPDILSQRDIEAFFASGSGAATFTTICQHEEGHDHRVVAREYGSRSWRSGVEGIG